MAGKLIFALVYLNCKDYLRITSSKCKYRAIITVRDSADLKIKCICPDGSYVLFLTDKKTGQTFSQAYITTIFTHKDHFFLSDGTDSLFIHT
jgi:hypothetical protein